MVIYMYNTLEIKFYIHTIDILGKIIQVRKFIGKVTHCIYIMRFVETEMAQWLEHQTLDNFL